MQTKRRPSKMQLKFELIWQKKPDLKMDGFPSLIFLFTAFFFFQVKHSFHK